MRVTHAWLGGALVCVFAMLAGCGAGGVASGDLDSLTEDANNNGFLDVEPPEGIEFLTLENMKINLTNTIDQSDVAGLAAQYGVDPSLLSLVTIVANFEVTLDYGDGITDTLTESERVEPFEKKFEIACPDRVTVVATVVVEVPLVGPQVITDFEIDLTDGVEFECGQTIEVHVGADAAGNPDVDLSIS